MDQTNSITNVRLNFFFDDEDELWECKLITPSNVTFDQIEEIIEKEHNFLCFEDKEDRYGIIGRTPETLINYICEKYNWKWEEHTYDIDLNLD